jgi:hypothetical protein
MGLSSACSPQTYLSTPFFTAWPDQYFPNL